MDHQLIFCTPKISKFKTGGVHKYINYRLLKNYRVDDYKKNLAQLVFSNYEILGDVHAAYSDFFQEIMTVIDKITPFKTKRMKGNTQKGFDGEVLEKLNSRDKLFQKFKKSRLHIDKELFEKAKYEALKPIATKGTFFKEKISESIGKPKELWESLKYLGMPNKTLISNFNVMEYSDTLTYDTCTISTVFKNFFSSLAEPLPTKLLNPPEIHNLESVINYYSSFTITDDFCLNKTSENKVLKK